MVRQCRPAIGIAGDLCRTLHRSVTVQKQQVNCSAVGATRIILISSDREIGHAVTVQVTYALYRSSEDIAVRQCRSTICAAGDFRRLLDRPVAVHQ